MHVWAVDYRESIGFAVIFFEFAFVYPQNDKIIIFTYTINKLILYTYPVAVGDVLFERLALCIIQIYAVFIGAHPYIPRFQYGKTLRVLVRMAVYRRQQELFQFMALFIISEDTLIGYDNPDVVFVILLDLGYPVLYDYPVGRSHRKLGKTVILRIVDKYTPVCPYP